MNITQHNYTVFSISKDSTDMTKYNTKGFLPGGTRAHTIFVKWSI